MCSVWRLLEQEVVGRGGAAPVEVAELAENDDRSKCATLSTLVGCEQDTEDGIGGGGKAPTG